MAHTEQLETLLKLVQLAGGFDKLPASDQTFFVAEGQRLLKEMMDKA